MFEKASNVPALPFPITNPDMLMRELPQALHFVKYLVSRQAPGHRKNSIMQRDP